MKLEELSDKSPYQKYVYEKNNFLELFNIFAANALNQEFKSSKRAALALVFFPTITNFYFGFISPYNMFKNIGRISVVVACFFNFQYQIYQDFSAVAETDTPMGNKIRKLFQNIAFEKDYLQNYFAKETMNIYSNSFFPLKIICTLFSFSKLSLNFGCIYMQKLLRLLIMKNFQLNS